MPSGNKKARKSGESEDLGYALAFEEGAEQDSASGGQQQRGRFRHKLEREIVHGKQ
jgi:hypothetical protein